MDEARIPDPVAALVGVTLGAHYYNHAMLNELFIDSGAPGEPPEGSCAAKCTAWLKRTSADPDVDALAVLGAVLRGLKDTNELHNSWSRERLDKRTQRIHDILGRHGLSYLEGGRIIGGKTGSPTRSLQAILRARDLCGLEIELQRALANVDTDPGAAITAACALMESLCKVYIEDEGLTLPVELTIKPLWKVVQANIDLDPGKAGDDDIRRVLSGLVSVIDGMGALRSHVGSAHGHGRRPYTPAPRHARLAIQAAHTLANFVIETWDLRNTLRTNEHAG